MLNETSNPNFQNATRFDEATQSNVKMTRSEYYNEKSEQGKSVGNRVALDMMVAAEKKEQIFLCAGGFRGDNGSGWRGFNGQIYCRRH